MNIIISLYYNQYVVMFGYIASIIYCLNLIISNGFHWDFAEVNYFENEDEDM